MTTTPNEPATALPGRPAVVDLATWQAARDELLVREKAHTREGDAIAAARRRLPMVEVDPTTGLIGQHGPVTLLDVFEDRRQLIAYYFMWYAGRPAPEQCEGCTFFTTHVRSSPSSIPVTSTTRPSARARTRRVCATATSWAGTCRGTQAPETRSRRS